jgi:hypothetical protein
MVDDMKLTYFNLIWLWLWAWRKSEAQGKKNVADSIGRIERLVAMGDVLNNSIEQAIHDTKRLHNKSSTRHK